MGVAPYYVDEKAGITLWHGDFREILPTLRKPGLILSDPPYGISYNREAVPQEKHLPARRRQVATVRGDEEKFDPSHLLGGRVILWGANCYASRLPDCPTWIGWDKVTRNGLDLRIGEIELAWTNCVSRPRLFRHLWSGGYRASGIDREEFLHPTQKPVALMEWCLLLVPEAKSVCDPYAGSGTTLVAAKRLGRRAVGIEIEERYCEVAALRLQRVTPPLLDAPLDSPSPPPRPDP